MRKYGQYLYQYLANQNKMGSDTKMYMRGEPTFFCGVCVGLMLARVWSYLQ